MELESIVQTNREGLDSRGFTGEVVAEPEANLSTIDIPYSDRTGISRLRRIFDYFIFVKISEGIGGKPFNAYKLRTMPRDADEGLEKVRRNGVDSYGNLVKDSRYGPVARIVRALKIDEMPQIFTNVLRGEMKWVGHRPHRTMDLAPYTEEVIQLMRENKPGFFGVNYVRGNDVNEKLRKYFIERRESPLWTDVKYFFKIWSNILSVFTRS